MRYLTNDEEQLINTLKINFTGSMDYQSGINDGMYELALICVDVAFIHCDKSRIDHLIEVRKEILKSY